MKFNSKISALYLTDNLYKYKSSDYQIDIIKSLSQKFDITEYGPNYSFFKENYKFNDIESLFQKKFNLLILGHSWLPDFPTNNNFYFKDQIIKDIKIPKIMFLNKEYVNLKDKIKFGLENKFDIIFSHHHIAKYLNKIYQTKFEFLPFATNFNNITQLSKKNYDLSFVGILKNLNKSYNHTNARESVRNLIYYNYRNINISKKKEFKSYKIFWQSHPRNTFENILSKIFIAKRLSKNDYRKVIESSRLVLNTPSPYDIIGPRYYDSLAVGSPIICPKKNTLYKHYFDDGDLIQFENMTDFKKKISFYIENKDLLLEKSLNILKKYKEVNYNTRMEKVLDLIVRI
jgi:hypothetical protein